MSEHPAAYVSDMSLTCQQTLRACVKQQQAQVILLPLSVTGLRSDLTTTHMWP